MTDYLRVLWLAHDSTGSIANCAVTTGGGHSNFLSDGIECNVINANMPHKTLTVYHIFLVRLGQEQRLRQPFAKADLPNVPKLH